MALRRVILVTTIHELSYSCQWLHKLQNYIVKLKLEHINMLYLIHTGFRSSNEFIGIELRYATIDDFGQLGLISFIGFNSKHLTLNSKCRL